MSAKNCCKTMEMELTAWKAIVYDIARKMEKSSAKAQSATLSSIGDLHIMIEEMDARIEVFRDKCSPETGMDDIQAEWDAYDKTMVNVRMTANEAMQTLSAGDFGG